MNIFDNLVKKARERIKTIDDFANEKPDWIKNNCHHQVRGVEDVIEIIRKYEEEYNNDFCEWEWGPNSAHVECQGDRILFENRRLFTFCPYCSKKIKEIN